MDALEREREHLHRRLDRLLSGGEEPSPRTGEPVDSSPSVSDLVLQALRKAGKPMHGPEIHDAVSGQSRGVTMDHVQTVLSKLKREGIVRNPHRGMWTA
jgi:hypothetical protein